MIEIVSNHMKWETRRPLKIVDINHIRVMVCLVWIDKSYILKENPLIQNRNIAMKLISSLGVIK